MKEYVVVANNEADIDSVHEDLTAPHGSDTIPNRPVEVADAKPLNERITNYVLTDEEAKKLANDSRVEAVHLKPDPKTMRPFTVQTPRTWDNRPGNFNRDGTLDNRNVNWGLRRTSVAAPEKTVGTTYEYEADGTGVDIVIMDDGVQTNHPEFLNAQGQSRVKEINWFTAAGVSGTMPTGFYDYTTYGDGEHGTHVAGIACGKTYGYAKNADIYSMRIFDDVNGAASFSSDMAFDLIKLWHQRKGTGRPTVVNMSWGYAWYYTGDPNRPALKCITAVNYRGKLTSYASKATAPLRANGMVGPEHGFRVPSIDAQVTDGEAAGIIYCAAAGNYGHKVDVPGGADYNNYYKLSFENIEPANTPVYYHRGSSPRGTIQVTAADVTVAKTGTALNELLASYSERGPGCDVVAPGTNIASSTSLQSGFGPYAYQFGTQQQTSSKAVSISGTSMATPQVTGVCALYLQRNPTKTPAQVKAWIAAKSKTNQVKTSTKTDDWTNSQALLGGPNRYLFNPYRNGYTD